MKHPAPPGTSLLGRGKRARAVRGAAADVRAPDARNPRKLGRPYYPESISGWFVRRRRAAGIPVGSIHVLRHTHATIALTEGVPLHVVAGRLGDDPKTVLDKYAHLLPRFG